jgi:hypothetical protein
MIWQDKTDCMPVPNLSSDWKAIATVYVHLISSYLYHSNADKLSILSTLERVQAHSNHWLFFIFSSSISNVISYTIFHEKMSGPRNGSEEMTAFWFLLWPLRNGTQSCRDQQCYHERVSCVARDRTMKVKNMITSTLMCWVYTLVEYEINSVTEFLVADIAQIRSSSSMFKNMCF